LLNGVGNLGASEGKVLQSAGETAIVSGIIEEIAVMERQFRARLYGGFDGVAVMHTCSINEIERILALRQMKTRGGPCDRDVEKVTKRT
jgi:hypothetical protein